MGSRTLGRGRRGVGGSLGKEELVVERGSFGMDTHLRTWKSRIEQMPILVQASEGDAPEGEDEDEGFHCVCVWSGSERRGRWVRAGGISHLYQSTGKTSKIQRGALVFTSQDPGAGRIQV